MKEQEITLKAYKEEVEILTMTLEVPSYELDDERRNWFPKYEDVLLKLFNNKREDKDILEIRNYYGSNKITIVINLTSYIGNGDREESIEHLLVWFKGGLDVADKDVQMTYGKANVYKVNVWENEKVVPYVGYENYIEWED